MVGCARQCPPLSLAQITSHPSFQQANLHRPALPPTTPKKHAHLSRSTQGWHVRTEIHPSNLTFKVQRETLPRAVDKKIQRISNRNAIQQPDETLETARPALAEAISQQLLRRDLCEEVKKAEEQFQASGKQFPGGEGEGSEV